MKKPLSIKSINFILWTKLIVLLLLILLSTMAFMLKAESGFFKGIYQAMCAKLGTVTPENVAQFEGYIFFHIILAIFTLRSIAKKSYKAVCWLLGLQLATYLKDPIMALLFIILLCTVLLGKKTKAYLKISNP